MSAEPLVTQQIKPADQFLWTVQTYLELVSRDTPLLAGKGLKRLFTLSSGVPTLYDADIEAITAKSERMGLIPANLSGFMTASIMKNMTLYGTELAQIIYDRIAQIACGDIRNPPPMVKYNPVESRRYYYLPPPTFIARLTKAVQEDIGGNRDHGSPSVTLQDVANDAHYLLARMQMSEGHITPQESAFGAMAQCVDHLVSILDLESSGPSPRSDYKFRSRGCLKILWVLAKLIMGDLIEKPERQDINRIDLGGDLSMTDGTLASIPFPVRQAVYVFSDEDTGSVSLRGRAYLSAVSAAAFYTSRNIESY